MSDDATPNGENAAVENLDTRAHDAWDREKHPHSPPAVLVRRDESSGVTECLLECVSISSDRCGRGSACYPLLHKSIYVCELAAGHDGPHQATPPPFTWECNSRCPYNRLIGKEPVDG